MPSGLKGPDMDFVFWIILIVLIVGVILWLLNRGSSTKTTAGSGRTEAGPGSTRADGALAGGSAAASAEAAGTAGIATAAGFGRPSEPTPPTTADDTSEFVEPAEASRSAEAASAVRGQPEPETTTASAEATPPPAAPPAGTAEKMAAAPDDDNATAVPGEETVQGTSTARGTDDQVEWETQWSEAGGSPVPHAAASAASVPQAGTADTVETDAVQTADTAAPLASPAHHPEYTESHSPTLPGAESAAAEVGVDEPAGTGPAESSTGESLTAESSTAESSMAGSGTIPEASGHLAADRPYGDGSASAGPDGSGPANYTVKGDAASMVYYEEGHPEYEQTRADVWFESAAYAEAAGFRAPRRTRLQ